MMSTALVRPKPKTKPTFKTLNDAIMGLYESGVERDRLVAESQMKTDQAIQRLTERIESLSVQVEKAAKGLSRANNSLGYLVEFIVAPGIRKKINLLGHNFRTAAANKLFRGVVNGKRQEITEVDVFLSNGMEVMAVEVKTALTVGWVKDHLDKLNLLREFEVDTKIQNKKLYGAVVGVFINEKARDFALKNGLYVLEIQEEEEKLTVVKPVRPRVW